jgi:hypothetical protein
MQFASFSWIPNSRPSSSVCCAPTPTLYLETVASRLASYTNSATNAAWPQHLATPACPLTISSLLRTLFPGIGSDSALINMTCPNCTTSCSCGDNCGCGSDCQCSACPGELLLDRLLQLNVM